MREDEIHREDSVERRARQARRFRYQDAPNRSFELVELEPTDLKVKSRVGGLTAAGFKEVRIYVPRGPDLVKIVVDQLKSVYVELHRDLS